MRTYEEAIEHLGNIAYSKYFNGSAYPSVGPDGIVDFAQLDLIIFLYNKGTLQEVYDDVCDVLDRLVIEYAVSLNEK